MKYLKRFNESSDNKYLIIKNIIDDLKDICIDFEDDGLTVRIFPQGDINIRMLSMKDRCLPGGIVDSRSIPFYIEIIKFEGYKRIFGLSDNLIDVIYHIVDYMKLNGYNTKLVSEFWNGQVMDSSRLVELDMSKLNSEYRSYTFQLVFEKTKVE